jgi:hypothetical protein
MREAAYLGYRVVMADGGSSEAFLDQAKEFPNVTVVDERSTFGKQKRAAIQTASEMEGAKYIFRNEPEKVDAISHLSAFIEPLFQSEADLVIGKRRDAEFRQSYPDYGYVLENGTNDLINKHLRENGILKDSDPDLDLYSGLIAFKNTPELIALFVQRYTYIGNEELHPMTLEGWMHAQIYGAVLALQKGMKVRQVEVPFWYANAQKLNEVHPQKIDGFKQKRVMQQDVGNKGVQLLAETLSGRNPLLVEE